MLLTRFTDEEEVHLERLASLLGRFFSRVIYLFDANERGVLRQGSYVAHVIDTFSRRQIVWFLDRGYSLGGGPPDAQDVDDALALMRGWVHLALNESRAEWPTWDLLSALRPFDLTLVDAKCHSEQQWQDDLHRMACLLGREADRGQLYTQYRLAVQTIKQRQLHISDRRRQRHNPLPDFRRGGPDKPDNNLEMWQSWVDNIFAEGREAFYELLLASLYRWRGCRFAGTSVIEKNPTLVDHHIAKRQLAAGADYEQCLARLTVDAKSVDHGQLVRRAQQSWADFKFGRPRASGQKRKGRNAHFGKPATKRSNATVATDETLFLQNRRDLVCEILSYDGASRKIEARGSMAAPASVTASVEYKKEMHFTDAKARKRLLQGSRENMLLPDEATPEIVAAAAAEEAKMVKAERDRCRARDRANLKQDGAESPILTKQVLRDKTIFVVAADGDVETLPAILVGSSLVETDDILAAQLVLVEDVHRHPSGKEWAWVAALRGLFLLTRDSARTGSGLSVKFKAGLRLRRELFFSDGFRAKHADIVALVRRIIHHGSAQLLQGPRPSNNWRILHTYGDYAAKALNNKPGVVALVLSREKASRPWCGYANVFTGPDFLKSVATLDHEQCFFEGGQL